MIERKRQCTCKITLFCVHVTIVTTETKQCVLCVLFRHITVNNIRILSVAQKCYMVNLYHWQLLMYLGFHVRSPIFLSVFNQFWSYLKDFHKSP